jgi:hypothetical protein
MMVPPMNFGRMPDLSYPAHASHHISGYGLATKQFRINSHTRYRARISLHLIRGCKKNCVSVLRTDKENEWKFELS